MHDSRIAQRDKHNVRYLLVMDIVMIVIVNGRIRDASSLQSCYFVIEETHLCELYMLNILFHLHLQCIHLYTDSILHRTLLFIYTSALFTRLAGSPVAIYFEVSRYIAIMFNYN